MTTFHRRTPVRVALAAALLAAIAVALVLSLAPSSSHADATALSVPDPLATGPYTAASLNPYLGGTVNLQEPNAAGGAASGANSAANLQVRGVMYYPSDHAKDGTSPVIVLVHGNHGSCAVGTAPNCTVFERNDLGYDYLAKNLATWGYTVVSLDQDQLIYYQDGTQGKGMHQRRLLIAANLDMLYAANQGTLPTDANNNIGDRLKGMLDFDRIGLMGHSRGGDAVTSFLDYNRTRPAPGRRYDIRAVDAVAPVDYERRAPYGTNYMTEFGACDGDVSNLQGARFYERSQYIQPGDPFARIQMDILGANHDSFNTIWYADGDDATTADAACGPTTDGNIRLTGGATNTSYLRNPDGTVGTAGSDDQRDMGDQEKIGLATMSEFFRTYVGGETAFAPYLTGELGQDGVTPASLPQSACPSSIATGVHSTAPGVALPCNQRIMTSYFAPPAERLDVIRPESEHPLTVSALGTSLTGSGFANPYQSTGGVSPVPATTAGGYDWCNPEPDHFTPSTEGLAEYPTAEKSCPLPVATAVGGQSTNRENSPVNQSYGAQLALAWDHPEQTTGAPATLATTVPQAQGDVSGLKTLTMAASVNFFDSRNPARTGDALKIPGALNADGVPSGQDFEVQLTDASGKTATVDAADPRYGEALGQTTGSANARLHIILNSIRIPLSDFATQGLDLTNVRKVSLVFGGEGEPQSGSIELADVRFQEATTPQPAVDPATVIAATKRDVASPANPGVVWVDGGTAAAVSGASGTCTDTTKPTAAITSIVAKKARLTIKGTAKDTGCRAGTSTRSTSGKVATVGVTVYRKVAGKYRYLTGSGALTKAQKATTALSVTTRTTSKWTLKFAKALPRGTYVAYVRAIDAAGNQQGIGRRHVIHVR